MLNIYIDTYMEYLTLHNPQLIKKLSTHFALHLIELQIFRHV